MSKLRRRSGAFLVLFFAGTVLLRAQEAPHTYAPEIGYVPDAETAVKIAEAVLIPIYGQDNIASQRPFIAELRDGVWMVSGTLHCPEGSRCLGGVALIEIEKDDGTIVRVSHGK